MQGHCQGWYPNKRRPESLKPITICRLGPIPPKLFLRDAILEILANFHVWVISFRLVPDWHSQSYAIIESRAARSKLHRHDTVRTAPVSTLPSVVCVRKPWLSARHTSLDCLGTGG